MRIEQLGSGEPAVAVVAAVHGDEPCGVRAIERLLDDDPDVERPVKFVVANERALDRGVRYVDVDMNRSYPGDETSDRHEERLASDLRAELAGTTTLSIHSTRSYADPFGATAGLTDADRRLFERLGLEYAVDVGGVSDRHLAQLPNYVEIEAGLQGTDAAARNAYDLTRRFLRATGVVPGTPERRDTSYVTIYETVPKRADATYSITARNFRPVEPDEEFARRDGTPIRATEAFVPVLMSSTGYEDILGFKSAVVD